MMNAVSRNVVNGVVFGSASNLVLPGESNMAPAIDVESLNAARSFVEFQAEAEHLQLSRSFESHERLNCILYKYSVLYKFTGP